MTITWVYVKFNQVVEHWRTSDPPADDAAVLDDVFRALSDRTRRDMLRRLAVGERTVGELAQPYEMSFEAASKHVRVLERAGLVRRNVRGRHHYCQLDARRLAEADRWLSSYQPSWTQPFAALDRVRAAKSYRSGPLTPAAAGLKPGPPSNRGKR